jgi:alpha-beta hydrolase superfamily lysophospholipase
MQITEKSFVSGQDNCVGDLYLPDDIVNPPVMVMAHGFAGERCFMLPTFAEKFCEQGMAVFLFDYRTFGDSTGKPRQWVHPGRQLQDWRAAIRYVQSMAEVDGDRLALWGTSFSGGHVVSLAAESHFIEAIIAQVPFVSGWNLLKTQTIKNLAQLTIAALIDSVRALFGASPYEYPIVGKPGSKGVMNTEGAYDGYLKLVPGNTGWRNSLPARVGLYVPWYSPLKNASKVQCPALIIAATKDNLIPVAAVREMANQMPDSEYVELETDHFQPYLEPNFSENIAIQQRFISERILGKR